MDYRMNILEKLHKPFFVPDVAKGKFEIISKFAFENKKAAFIIVDTQNCVIEPGIIGQIFQ